MRPRSLIVVDDDATAELHVKTVKYFKSIERVQEEVDRHHAVTTHWARLPKGTLMQIKVLEAWIDSRNHARGN